eukprot:gnl/MRDRNA2_/MRDRNA2_87717_c0_seq1.p1 gnl/MRDRNA2_/MRDRNA2_87717_c0~~gnl/MRDRNA2_/MRDRNA2_87717_c0_seq1.p1  ORF type:complete len:126 (-),score=31.93 gnl/MRDRNA2_/MRDRNA2_87717_c0_seq1:869-1246(-)
MFRQGARAFFKAAGPAKKCAGAMTAVGATGAAAYMTQRPDKALCDDLSTGLTGAAAGVILGGIGGYYLAGPPSKVVQAKTIAPGDKVPPIVIDHGFNPIGKVNMAERCKGKKVIILGLPGAFTPC